MILWRIATESRRYRADDLSGGAAGAGPGRWNDTGEPVLYCAPTIAIAVLETAAHIDDAGFPLNKSLVEITVPDIVWDAREAVAGAALPPAWNAVPAGRASVQVGSAWLTSLSSLVLLLPSDIVPEEQVALINPRHALTAKITAKTVRKFEYNNRFRKP